MAPVGGEAEGAIEDIAPALHTTTSFRKTAIISSSKLTLRNSILLFNKLIGNHITTPI